MSRAHWRKGKYCGGAIQHWLETPLIGNRIKADLDPSKMRARKGVKNA